MRLYVWLYCFRCSKSTQISVWGAGKRTLRMFVYKLQARPPSDVSPDFSVFIVLLRNWGLRLRCYVKVCTAQMFLFYLYCNGKRNSWLTCDPIILNKGLPNIITKMGSKYFIAAATNSLYSWDCPVLLESNEKLTFDVVNASFCSCAEGNRYHLV